MVIVVGNSRLRRQSKNRNEGTYPLTGLALKPVSGLRKSVDVLQPRNPLRVEAEVVDALQEPRIGVAAPAVLHAGEQPAPRLVVGLGVQLVRLVDVQPPFGLRLLDERRPRRRQAFAGPRSACTPAMTASSRSGRSLRCRDLLPLVPPRRDPAALPRHLHVLRRAGGELRDLSPPARRPPPPVAFRNSTVDRDGRRRDRLARPASGPRDRWRRASASRRLPVAAKSEALTSAGSASTCSAVLTASIHLGALLVALALELERVLAQGLDRHQLAGGGRQLRRRPSSPDRCC